MALEFVLSNKGKKLLVIDGFTFRAERTITSSTYWICTKAPKCKARCITMETCISSQSGKHTHTIDSSEIGKRKILEEIKQAAKSTQEIPSRIIATSTLGIPVAVAASLPNPKLLSSAINYTRRLHVSAPPNPQHLSDLKIPIQYQYTMTGEKFLTFDSGSICGDSRVLMFSTIPNLVLLSESDAWYVDGTFKSAPLLFTQHFTIHVKKDGVTLPLIYGLLPSKLESSYETLFLALNNACNENNIILNPKSITSDFEKGIINALETVFPTAEKKGCYFHFSQAVFKKIKKFPAILKKYKDPDFALHLRMLTALAFVPPETIVPAFDILMGTEYLHQFCPYPNCTL